MSIDAFIVEHPLITLVFFTVLIIFSLLAPLYAMNREKMRSRVGTKDGLKLIAITVILGLVVLYLLQPLFNIFE